jgi:hypothetical protein
MKMIFLTIALIVSTMAIACNEDGTSGIVEENNVKIPVDAKRLAGLSEAQFNAVIVKVEAVYAPIVSSQMDGCNRERQCLPRSFRWQ